MKKLFLLLILIFLFLNSSLDAQENIFTAGFQYRRIFPSAFFQTGSKTVSKNGIDFSIAQKSGYNAGMVLRRGFTKKLSLETGISYTKRNFSLSISDTTFTGKSGFTIIGYEIPVQGMIFLRITDKIYISTSLGASMDMYATNIATYGDYFNHLSKYRSIFQFAALASLGTEYRTAKNGYFYLGAGYHQPFSYCYSSSLLYKPTQEIARINLNGNYIAIDLRYYFHEDIMKPKKKKRKQKKELVN